MLLAELYHVILNYYWGFRGLQFANRKPQNKTSHVPRKARMLKLFSILQYWSYKQ
jgi:hypothetical protein